MSRATINTGGIDFKLSGQSSDNIISNNNTAMHIAILADLSGRKNRGDIETHSLTSRKLIEINRDNFDEVFGKLKVRLQLPICDEPLVFKELDDLHPDFIYERIKLFDQLRILKRKLNNKDSYDSAAQEIQTWANYQGEQTVEPTVISITESNSLLDAALQGFDITNQVNRGPLGSIDNLIKDIVSPFIEKKTDVRKPQMLAAVDKATSKTMRSIMHHSDFQQLEASWRALYWLIRRIETNNNLRVFVMDVCQEELRSDLSKPTKDSHLFQQLVESHRTTGDTPFSIILGDYLLKNSIEDAELASQMAALAADGNGCWLSGGHEQLAGCNALHKNIDPDNWNIESLDQKIEEKWQQMRSLPYASHLALATPRFLLRLPYGSKTSLTDNFEYEELTAHDPHDFYLWGNGAFLVVCLLAESFTHHGWSVLPGHSIEVQNLPLHVYDDDGTPTVKPCAEVLLTDRATTKLNSAGLLTLRSVKNKDCVKIPEFLSMAKNKCRIQGFW